MIASAATVADAPVTADAGVVELTAADLRCAGVVYCPNPRMPLWSGHPRVFLDVASTGHARCPYCGTLYRLAGGAAAATH